MRLEVSIGEAIDKLSILELKLLKITNESKKEEIQKEINELSECKKYKDHYLYYNLLMYVNEKIWDMTDTIKNLAVDDSNFAIISNQIFEFNQKRFRIKNWYNLIYNSNIKEQKSYSLSQCKIIINNKNTFYKKISELLFLALEYDCIYISSDFNDIITNIVRIPTVNYVDVHDNSVTNVIYLENFEVDDKKSLKFFELNPIVYVSGGLLGDFIHQLSVINEKFLNTGRKGILYIANNIGGDNFRYELSTTFTDTYKLISEQTYIKQYKIYNNEPYDINLSGWRNNMMPINWHDIFFNNYNINWGLNKWIDISFNEIFENSILISTNSYRPAYNIDFLSIAKIYGKSVKFIDLNENETNYFKNLLKDGNLEESIDFYKPTNIYDLCVAINSCKLFIGNFSMPLSLAYSMHKKSVVGLFSRDENQHIGLENIITNLIINKDILVTLEEIKALCG